MLGAGEARFCGLSFPLRHVVRAKLLLMFWPFSHAYLAILGTRWRQAWFNRHGKENPRQRPKSGANILRPTLVEGIVWRPVSLLGEQGGVSIFFDEPVLERGAGNHDVARVLVKEDAQHECEDEQERKDELHDSSVLNLSREDLPQQD